MQNIKPEILPGKFRKKKNRTSKIQADFWKSAFGIQGPAFTVCTERIINSKPKKIGHVYRECTRPAYSTPYIGQVLPQENKAGKAQGTPQDRGTAPHRSTAHRRKNKRVHKSTSRCAIVVAWSTRGQTTRSHPTTPLAPLREDMAQGIRACAVSSFACRRGTASP